MLQKTVWAMVIASVTTVAGIGTAAAQAPPPKTEAELLAADNKPMTAAQIMSTYLGNTEVALTLAQVGDLAPGGTAKTYYRDNKVRISVPQGGPKAGKKLEGKWWMEGDLMCGERVLTGTGNACRSLYQVGSSIYSCGKPAGNCNVLVRMLPGNPDKI